MLASIDESKNERPMDVQHDSFAFEMSAPRGLVILVQPSLRDSFFPVSSEWILSGWKIFRRCQCSLERSESRKAVASVGDTERSVRSKESFHAAMLGKQLTLENLLTFTVDSVPWLYTIILYNDVTIWFFYGWWREEQHRPDTQDVSRLGHFDMWWTRWVFENSVPSRIVAWGIENFAQREISDWTLGSVLVTPPPTVIVPQHLHWLWMMMKEMCRGWMVSYIVT